ncbi:MAG: site-2 protease family protein [Clostridiales bacterium]|nr:site-2 protease family protein [Clostridiales bacterium]
MGRLRKPEPDAGGLWFGRCFLSAGAVFWLTLLCMRFSGRLMSAVLLSAALHEGGHLWACRLCRVRVRAVRITVWGAELLLEELHRPLRRLAVAGAGPAVSLLCAFAAAFAFPRQGWAQLFAGASLILGLFNLLPVPPLDGGRILLALLELAGLGVRAEGVVSRLTTALLVLSLAPGAALALAGNPSLLLLELWLLFQQRND